MSYLLLSCFIFNLIICVYSYTNGEALQHIQGCLSEMKVTPVDYLKMKRDKTADSYCILACIMKKRETIVDGKINPEKMLNNLKKMRVASKYLDEEKIKQCSETANAKDDECLVAQAAMDCLFTADLD